VLHKPAGYAVHRTGDEDIPDLQRWAAEALDAPASLSPVHRLDRETSGVVVFAAEPDRLAEGGGWFAEGLVKKRYLALVFGRVRQKGIIRRPLQDARRGRRLEAVTRYRRRASYGAFSFLEVRPETGRRHQIRKHLHGIGHAIVGDTRYRAKRFRAVPGFPGRLWLHAAELELPGGVRYESPLPPELVAHLALLEARSP
jgi:tRNA pseudouridine65 synthase